MRMGFTFYHHEVVLFEVWKNTELDLTEQYLIIHKNNKYQNYTGCPGTLSGNLRGDFFVIK